MNIPTSGNPNTALRPLSGGGEMGELIRNKDWIKTPLGTHTNWPQSLRTALSIVLHSKFPMFLFWGPELICFYNDAYRPSLGIKGKHPDILGQRAEEAWPETWDIIKPLINQVLAGSEATWNEDQLIPIYRNGKIEDVYWTFSYSPVNDESGKPAGVFVTCSETTEKVNTFKILEESNRRYFNNIMQAPVAMCIFRGKNHVIEIANSLMLKLWDKTAAQVISRPIFEVLPEAKVLGIELLIDNVFITGEKFVANECPVNLKRKGTTETTYINFVCEALREPNGSITGIVVIASEVTLLVAARKNLEESEEQLRNALDGGELGTYDFYPQTGKLIWSVKTKEMFGLMPDAEVDYDVYLTGLHPDDKERLKATVEKAMNAVNGGLHEDEYRTIGITDGRLRWVRSKGKISFDAMGKPVRWSGVTQDITQRRQAEQEFQYRKALLEAHNEASVDGILLVGAKGKIISYNRRFMEIWNMPKEIADAKDDKAALCFAMTQLVNPQGFIEKVNYFYDHPAEKDIDELEFKDGKIVERQGYPVVGEDGTYYAWSWTFKDITEQKKSEQKLIESLKKFRNLMESLPQMTWTNLPTGEVNFYNQKWYNYTGSNYEQTKEWGWKPFVHPDDLPSTLKAYTEALETGNVFVVENRYKRNDGEYHWHLNRALPVENDKGEIILWVGTATDIDLQKTEEEQLENLVAERTIALERANEDLQQFAHVASHDLKEPVRKIKLFAGRLQEEMQHSLNKAGKLYLSKVQSAADRLVNMIDGVLAYSGLNNLDEKIENIGLDETIGNIVTDLELLIQQKEAIITYNNLPRIEGAPVLIYQLFYDLINNSLKFAKTDERLFISILSNTIYLQNKPYARVEIRDNGIGFEQEYAKKIFDTFTRLNPKDKYEGAGLGLSLCKKIVQLHHGTIEATGLGTEGAVFTIILPHKQKD